MALSIATHGGAENNPAMSAPSLRALLPDLGRRTLVMGVLNVTPDSFSDGGCHADPEVAIEAGVRMFAAGAALVDVGGESTRPGAEPVSVEEELARVLPVIEGLAGFGFEGISVDTTKAEVARQAVEAGARMVNDISALSFDPAMPATVAALGVPVVLSHTRGSPKTMQQGVIEYEGGVVQAVKDALAEALELALDVGVGQGQILLDPGIGFGKTLEHNLELLRGLGELRCLGQPVLVGTSRKTFIGTLTGKAAAARDAGTAATVALSVQYGADIVRVHDVETMVDVVKVADALVRG